MEVSEERKKEINNIAQDVLKEVHYTDNSGAVDIIAIAEKLGFAVGNAVMTDDADGFVIVKKGEKEILGIKTDRLIGVNSEKDLEWKRFIIAHELGHYKLESNAEEIYAHREHKTGKNMRENEADFFAACILMPQDIFEKNYNELKKREENKEKIITTLADKFVVTPRMVARRIGELGLYD